MDIFFGLGMVASFLAMALVAGLRAVNSKSGDHIPGVVLSFWTIGCIFGLVMFVLPYFESEGFVNSAERILAMIPLTTFGLQLLSLIPVWKYKLTASELK